MPDPDPPELNDDPVEVSDAEADALLAEIRRRQADFDGQGVEGFKKTLFHFPVLHEGWEMDNHAWVVELVDGSRQIVTTNHGGIEIPDPQDFVDKVAEYEAALDATRTALGMLAHAPRA